MTYLLFIVHLITTIKIIQKPLNAKKLKSQLMQTLEMITLENRVVKTLTTDFYFSAAYETGKSFQST
jgi:hypothetical protein